MDINIDRIGAVRYAAPNEMKKDRTCRQPFSNILSEESQEGRNYILPKETAGTQEEHTGSLPVGGKAAEETTESETKTDIIVRPDGSRVLVVTTTVGGMQTNVSLKISGPTDMPNESRQDNANNGKSASERITAGRLAGGLDNAVAGTD